MNVLKAALGLVCLSPSLSLAQVSITSSMINPDDSPVQIASLRKDLSNLIASVDIRNNSSRTIDSLTLQWAIGVPEACAKNPVSAKFGDPETLSTDTHPGETAKFSNLGPKTSDVIQFLHENSAHFANIQVLVTEVRFTDGTSWSTAIDTSRIFDASELHSFDGRCKNGNLVPVASNCMPRPAGTLIVDRAAITVLGQASGPDDVGCVWRCIAQNSTYCSGGTTSCTGTICPNPKQCANQGCELECD